MYVCMIIPVHHLPQKKHVNLSSQLPCHVKTLLECILHIGDSGKILTTKGTKLHPFYLK